MENYILNKNDIEDLEILKQLGYSVFENKQKLSELEISGQKQSEEYKKITEALKSTLFLEDNIYNRIGTDFNKLKSMNNYLNNKYTNYGKDISNIENQMSILIYNDIEYMIISRIINRLIKREIYENRENLNVYNKVVYSKKTKGLIKLSSFGYLVTNLEIRKDILDTILVILNKEINNDKNNKNIVDFLIKIKYYISLIYKNIEDDLINNNFEINPELYWTSKSIAQYYKIPDELYNIISLNYSKNIVVPNLQNISKLNDKDFETEPLMAIIKLREIILRAGILFCSDDIISIIKNTAINNQKIRKTKSDKLILDAIEKAKSDCSERHVITLNLKKES